MVFDLPDPDPCTDLDPSIIKQNRKKNLLFFVTYFLFMTLSLKNDVNFPSKSKKQKM
jgi:hypothetical protein